MCYSSEWLTGEIGGGAAVDVMKSHCHVNVLAFLSSFGTDAFWVMKGKEGLRDKERD